MHFSCIFLKFFRHLEKSAEIKDKDDKYKEVVEDRDISVTPRPSIILKNLRDTGEFTSWKEGKLVFRSETLENLATKLERFYNVKIFKDDSIKDLRYTGTLEEATIEEVLRAISTDSTAVPHNILLIAPEHQKPEWYGCPTLDELETAPYSIRRMYHTWLYPTKIQLYNLEDDPWEFNDIANKPENFNIKKNLLNAIFDWQEQI